MHHVEVNSTHVARRGRLPLHCAFHDYFSLIAPLPPCPWPVSWNSLHDIDRILPLMSDWIHTLSRVTFGGSSMSPLTTPSASVRRQGSGGSTSQSGRVETPSGSERQVCADLLRRCLALRNSVNTVVSKFLELRIDEEGRDCKASTSTSRDNVDKYFFKWGEGSSSGLGSKRPRFQIRLDEAHSQAVRRAART